MSKVVAAVAVALLAHAPAAVAQQAEVLVVVRQFVDGFNKGDIKTAVAACADQTSIIDEFPPYEWHGPSSCTAWANAYDADAKKNGIADGVVTLGKPLHLDVAANRAYVVIPSEYAFKQRGKPVKEIGSMFTFALEKGPPGWRIVGWSWAKNQVR